MKYLSTRGQTEPVSFNTALMTGLAPDGGLYLPESWPGLSAVPQSKPYRDAALQVMAPFLGGEIETDEFATLLSHAYENFSSTEPAPLREIGKDLYILELFHGPTLAFKDFAMQVLARLMERSLKRGGSRMTIVGATSGDTGAAAVEAFRGREDIEVYILYPHGRVSDVQRRQMTTAAEDNIHILAVEGSFDDAQAIVKALFNDQAFRTRHALSAINSINWARIMAQAVYYFTATAELSAARPLQFAVPTGNFGDVFAGYVAHKMGLPLDRLVVATNENDILARALKTGVYEPLGVHQTDSPSMDIQVSSNFERLLFEASSRDFGFVRSCMAKLRDEGRFSIRADVLTAMRGLFSAHRVTMDEAALAMRELERETGYIVDPHTAVGLVAAKREQAARDGGPMVVLGTAHPAKFPDAIRRAVGRSPEVPHRLGACMAGIERFKIVPNSVAAVEAVINACG